MALRDSKLGRFVRTATAAVPAPEPAAPLLEVPAGTAAQQLATAELAWQGFLLERDRMENEIQDLAHDRVTVVDNVSAPIADILAIDERVKVLRLELARHARQRDGLQSALSNAWKAVRAEEWEQARPGLIASEAALTDAIAGLYTTLNEHRRLCGLAAGRGFEAEMREIVVPAPADTTSYCLTQFIRGTAGHIAIPSVAGVVPAMQIVREVRPQFVPGIVDWSEIRKLGVLVERMVEFTWDCNTKGSPLIPGFSHITAGTRMSLSERSAAHVVMFGVAKYIDFDESTPIPAAAAEPEPADVQLE